MKMPSAIRVAMFALAALAGVALTSAARADEGFVQLTIYKAGWIIGGSGGSGVAEFPRPALSAVDRRPRLRPGVRRLEDGAARPRQQHQPPSDVAGVYGAAGAGLAVGRGARAIVLTNQKGAVLELTGQQVGLMANADLSGLAITMK